MTYQIGRWYIEYNDGVIGPCYNWATAKYYVDNGYAVRMFNPTEEFFRV